MRVVPFRKDRREPTSEFSGVDLQNSAPSIGPPAMVVFKTTPAERARKRDYKIRQRLRDRVKIYGLGVKTTRIEELLRRLGRTYLTETEIKAELEKIIDEQLRPRR